MGTSHRSHKVADRIKVVVAQLLETKIKDPRLGFVTVTDARVTGEDLGTRITPSLEFILDGLPESAKALDTLLERVHLLDAEVAKARENAKPVVEDPYKVPRVIEED